MTVSARTAATVALAMSLSLPAVAAPSYQVIYRLPNFTGYASTELMSELLIGPNGAIYAAETSGGSTGQGAIFMLTPPPPGQTAWTRTDLYSFAGAADGAYPVAGLVMDGGGNLYGTTSQGGAFTHTARCRSTCGIVFELTPPAAGGTAWTKTTLYSFVDGDDGVAPASRLLIDNTGALFGVTLGGHRHDGTAFRLAPPAANATTWQFSTLHQFAGHGDGATPTGAIAMDSGGALIGATQMGGGSGCNLYGCGTIFRLAPPVAGQKSWTESILYRFDGLAPTTAPSGGIMLAKDGVIYGASTPASDDDYSSLFELTPPVAQHGAWTMNALHRFGLGADGIDPISGLTTDQTGALYGTTFYGGQGQGVVYKFIPPTGKNKQWQETILHYNNMYNYSEHGVVVGESDEIFGTYQYVNGQSGQNVTAGIFEIIQ